MNAISDSEFIVVDKNGREWGRYCYRVMAEAVAERNNDEPSIRDSAPFTVRENGSDDVWGAGL